MVEFLFTEFGRELNVQSGRSNVSLGMVEDA